MTTPPEGPGQPGSPDDGAGQGWQPQWQPQYPSQHPPQGPPPGYPAPAYGYAVPEHPKAMTSMILGILGLVLCQVVAPFAWMTGKKTVAEIDASGGRLGGRGQAQAGYILGIVGTVLLALGAVFLLIYFVIFIMLIGGMAATSP